MSWVAVGVGAASIGLSLLSAQQAKNASVKEADLTRRAGESRKQSAELEADVLQAQAGQVIAASQRDAIDVNRQTRLAISRTVALAAASGGGASTAAGIHTLVSTAAKEGSYNAARTLYAGEEKARLMKLQAVEMRRQGEFYMGESNLAAEAVGLRGQAQQQAAYSQALSSGGGMYAKYGGKGWGNTPTTQTGAVGDFNLEPTANLA